MSPVETKTFKVKRGFTYNYEVSKAEGSKPTLLFLHGFPESHYCYRHQVKFFSEGGYGVICPDLLGYDKTDKPTDLEAYAFALQTGDLVDILDHESVSKVFVIGHDWGCLPAGRMLNIYPERCTALCLIAAGYFPPKSHWTTDAFNAGSKQLLGYETMGYFPFTGAVSKDGSPTEACTLIKKNIDSFMALMFSRDNPETWQKHFCPTGAARSWLQANTQGPYNVHLSDEEFNYYKTIIHRDIESNLNWYRSVQEDVHFKYEQDIPDENANIKQPVLFLSATKDAACQPALYEGIMPMFMKDLKVVPFQTSHWLVTEEPDRANKEIQTFIEEKNL